MTMKLLLLALFLADVPPIDTARCIIRAATECQSSWAPHVHPATAAEQAVIDDMCARAATEACIAAAVERKKLWKGSLTPETAIDPPIPVP